MAEVVDTDKSGKSVKRDKHIKGVADVFFFLGLIMSMGCSLTFVNA